MIFLEVRVQKARSSSFADQQVSLTRQAWPFLLEVAERPVFPSLPRGFELSPGGSLVQLRGLVALSRISGEGRWLRNGSGVGEGVGLLGPEVQKKKELAFIYICTCVARSALLRGPESSNVFQLRQGGTHVAFHDFPPS